jgi:thiol:disulfide interchange protein DsbC
MRMRFFSPLLLTVVLTTACNAGDGEIKKNIEERFPGAKVNSISKSPLPGIYEVVVDGSQVIYADENANHVMVGDLLETRTKRNLTREKADKLAEVKFDSLPLDQALKFVKGDGSRKLAVFSDPDCPYCRRLEGELGKLNNVTIYNFIYPLPMHADAARKGRAVWCSANPNQAWVDMMLNGKEPQGSGDCPNPVQANTDLGIKLNIQGTPAMFLSNGRRVPGLVPADKIEAMLAEAAAAK